MNKNLVGLFAVFIGAICGGLISGIEYTLMVSFGALLHYILIEHF